MGLKRSSKFGTTLSAIIVVAAMLANAATAMAQSQGVTGFDWIGTDPNNIADQRCYASNLEADLNYNRTLTAWTPPASGTPKAQWSYSMQNFRAQVGVIPIGPHTPMNPSEFAGWALYVYDSFDRFRANANVNYRALFTFAKSSPSITYGESLGCHYYAGGQTDPIPCYRLTLNLNQPTSVEYKTASGQVTATPLKLAGGTRYWFSLVGFQSTPSPDITCVVRTTPGLPQTVSPLPNPPVSFALNEWQIPESGLGGAPFPLAHSDFQKSSDPLCDTHRTPVNYMSGYSSLPPYLEWTGNGLDPRTCGAPNQNSCCERTQSAHWAKALSVKRITTVLSTLSATAVKAYSLVEVCRYPDC